MSKYFDKDFFKFFLRFAAILSISIIIIMAARVYQDREFSASGNTTSVIKSFFK